MCHCTKDEVFHLKFPQEMWQNRQETADLVTFTEEILNVKLHFFATFSPWFKSLIRIF